jgi:acyl carrier protein
MDRKISFDEFRKMIADYFGIALERISRGVSFSNDLGIDSLSLVNFIVKLEKNYGIKIDLDYVWSLSDIGEAYDTLVARMNPKESESNTESSALSSGTEGTRE